MKLEDIGEKSLQLLAQDLLKTEKKLKVGIGDDAAAIEINKKSILVSTDMMLENIHFFSDSSPSKIGKKAVMINVSDLAAMGGKPLGLVFSLGLPKEKDVDYLIKLLKGMNSEAKTYDTQIIGGDLNESKDITISGTVIGLVKTKNILERKGANPGDYVCVTGTLGINSANLLAKKKNKSKKWKKIEEIEQKKRARLEESKILTKIGGTTSAIDITDGLASNLWQIANPSQVELLIEKEKIPVHPVVKDFCKKENENLNNLILFGGGDYELLVTVNPNKWKSIKKEFNQIDTKITRIGKVNKGEGVRIKKDKETKKLPNKGYEHFLTMNQQEF